MRLPNWLLLITMPLGVARATWLVMNDRILKAPRHWIEHKGGYPAYFIKCPWCVSMWVAAIAVVLMSWDITDDVTEHLLVIGALSVFAVLFERIVDRTPMLMDEAPFPSLPEHEAAIERAEAPPEVTAALAQKE